MLNSYRIPAVASVVSAVIVLCLLVVPQLENGLVDNASAGDGPLIVRGYVYDSDGRPVPGANVTIKMIYGISTVRSTMYYDSTESNGLYTVTFLLPSSWEIGDTIEVTGKYSVYQTTNSTTAVSSIEHPIQYVNVTLAFQIPEFGGVVFSSVTFSIIVLTLMVCVLSRNRRKQQAA